MAHLGFSAGGVGGDAEAFWTACPHCCYVHSYPRIYLGRRLRCPTPACRRAFPGTGLPAAPPIVPGADMYFCAWAFFPLGPPFTAEGWMPFTPFHPFNPPPSPSPAPNPAAAASADTPSRAGPTSRTKVGVCFKGRARAEAEEETAAAAVDLEAEAGMGVLGERGDCNSDFDIDLNFDFNETVDLSELGLRVDEMGVVHDLP